MRTSARPRPVALVFARHPDSGAVKTRLAAAIGPAAARAVYRDLAERVWRGLAHPALARWLLVEPPEDAARAAAWLSGADACLPQASGDLGARLAAGFAAAFAAGAPAAVAVGTDAPALNSSRLLEACAALQGHDVVLVPALDGGYALVGMREPHPELFTAMPWSTPQLLEACRARLRQAGLSWCELAPVRDLDTEADWRALQAEGLLP